MAPSADAAGAAKDAIGEVFGEEAVALSTDKAFIGPQRTVADLASLPAEQLAEVSNDHSVILAVLPEITPKETAVFVLGASCDVVPGTLEWHGFPKPAENNVALAAGEEECLFLNDGGEPVTSVPENGHVNAAVKLTKGKTYAPVITAETANDAPVGPTSDKGSGGGCDGLSGGLMLWALVGAAARKRR